MLDVFPTYLIPVVIFFARIMDVSLGTLRIIYVGRGMKMQAAVLGFIEVLIWLIVVTQIMQNLDYFTNYIAFAGGFGVGNYVGIWIENKLMVGNLIYRVITNRDATELIGELRNRGYGVTELEGEGASGKVNVIFTVVRRKKWREIQNLIESYLPKSFYSIEEVKHVNVNNGTITRPHLNRVLGSLLSIRKSI